MNLRLLEIFQTVCRTESITKAAESLHMTQPAVSQAIRTLEQDTGLILFDRLSRRIYLTEMGRNYLDKTEPLLALCQDLENSTQGIRQTAVLRVGSCLTIAQFWLTEIQSMYQSVCQNPVETTVAGARKILSLLENNQIDFGLYEGPAPGTPFVSEVFSSYRLIPVCSDQHPFAGKKVSVEDFLKEDLLLREPGSALRDVLDSFLRLRGLEAHPTVVSTTSSALVEQCRANLGVCILPDCALTQSFISAGLAAFSVTGMNLTNNNRIVFHQDKIIPPHMNIYLELIRNEKGAVG